MNRLPITGGLYADCTPDGEWAVLIPSREDAPGHIETSKGVFPLPPGGDPLFLRMTVYQRLMSLAGQGHDDGRCWYYDHPMWRDVGPTAGVSPCVFGDGRLFIASSSDGHNVDTLRTIDIGNGTTWDRPVPIGSQGLRYVTDGQPVTGDASFHEGDYFEFTRLGDVTVGQGAIGGCVINGRLLEPGDCRFVRMSREGDQLGIAIVKIPERQAVFYWLTVAEIASLPPYRTEPDPPNPPNPPEPPVPEMPASLESDVRAERAKYPAILADDQPAKILNAVAWAHRADGWGLSVKRSGEKLWPSPQGVPVAYDILHHKPTDTLWDVATGESAFEVKWGQTVHHNNPDRPWLAPVAPSDEPTQPVPTGGSIDAQIKALIDAAMKPLRADIEKLKTQKPAEPSPVSLNGVKVALRTDNGHYVCAESGGGGDVNASRESAGGWETFTIETR